MREKGARQDETCDKKGARQRETGAEAARQETTTTRRREKTREAMHPEDLYYPTRFYTLPKSLFGSTKAIAT